MATKTLNIYASGLLTDTTLMLMFNPPNNEKLFIDQFPHVWKVITFRARAHSKASVTYVARLAFGYTQIDRDNLTEASSWEECYSGQSTTLIDVTGGKTFTPAVRSGNGRLLTCGNNTSSRSNIGIGFVRGDGPDQRYEPALSWTNVGSKSNITAQFTPTLTAYVTREYQATELIRGEVETLGIWTRDLNQLDDVTGWNLTVDGASGSYSLEPASRP